MKCYVFITNVLFIFEILACSFRYCVLYFLIEVLELLKCFRV